MTAVPNSCSDDLAQDIHCVLEHYDSMVKLVGLDQVGIGTDTSVGNPVAWHRVVLGRQPEQLPAPYLKGLESPTDGKNMVRGLIQRGYGNTESQKIADGNARAFFRRVIYEVAHKGI
jgi:microsomal dipeptidase-like Zn-dependent dipeptidase